MPFDASRRAERDVVVRVGGRVVLMFTLRNSATGSSSAKPDSYSRRPWCAGISFVRCRRATAAEEYLQASIRCRQLAARQPPGMLSARASGCLAGRCREEVLGPSWSWGSVLSGTRTRPGDLGPVRGAHRRLYLRTVPSLRGRGSRSRNSRQQQSWSRTRRCIVEINIRVATKLLALRSPVSRRRVLLAPTSSMARVGSKRLQSAGG
eukprot:6586487-Prymnesium_polylepis.1